MTYQTERDLENSLDDDFGLKKGQQVWRRTTGEGPFILVEPVKMPTTRKGRDGVYVITDGWVGLKTVRSCLFWQRDKHIPLLSVDLTRDDPYFCMTAEQRKSFLGRIISRLSHLAYTTIAAPYRLTKWSAIKIGRGAKRGLGGIAYVTGYGLCWTAIGVCGLYWGLETVAKAIIPTIGKVGKTIVNGTVSAASFAGRNTAKLAKLTGRGILNLGQAALYLSLVVASQIAANPFVAFLLTIVAILTYAFVKIAAV